MLLMLMSLLLNVAPAHAIIGGEKVASDDAISKVTVMLLGQTEKGGFSCTGTILSDAYILTAAHCVLNVKNIFILFTTDAPQSSWSTLLNNPSVVRRAISVNHNIDYPNTDLGSVYPHNDIGLVKFTGGIPAGYHPVTLLNPSVMSQYLAGSTPVVIAGFGMRAKEDIPNNSGSLYKETIPFQRVLAKKDAYVGADGTIACHGDSGGPAFVKVNGQYYQWGVASRSDCSTFSVYTPLTSNFFGKMATP